VFNLRSQLITPGASNYKVYEPPSISLTTSTVLLLISTLLAKVPYGQFNNPAKY